MLWLEGGGKDFRNGIRASCRESLQRVDLVNAVPSARLDICPYYGVVVCGCDRFKLPGYFHAGFYDPESAFRKIIGCWQAEVLQPHEIIPPVRVRSNEAP